MSCNQSSHATAERCVAAEGQVVTEGPASVGKCGFEELWLMGSAKAKMKGDVFSYYFIWENMEIIILFYWLQKYNHFLHSQRATLIPRNLVQVAKCS